MHNIEVKVLNPEGLIEAERMMLAAATLTQKSHKLHTVEDFLREYEKPIDEERVTRLSSLPHPTLQKLGSVSVIVAGLSRRALAQITRHQNEIKFIAGSLQYSDHSEAQEFVFPAEAAVCKEEFKTAYTAAAKAYDALVAKGISPDAAAYVLPQGFRTSLIMTATPYQLKHMIRQRTCRRNTHEVRVIFFKIAQALIETAPELFSDEIYPPCAYGKPCPEGKMSCGSPIAWWLDKEKR